MRSLIADENNHKLSVEFAYDYMGRRVTKDVYHYTGDPASPGSRTFVSRILYLYQGWTILAEYVGASLATPGPLARSYTWGPDLSGTMGGAGDIGGLLAIEDMRAATQGVYHPAYDGNGNLMALAKADTGEMVAAYEYDPFGNSLRASGSYAKENPFRFSGKYYDNETGLTYSGFRYYSASLGRFINRDPLEERGGWTLYKDLKQGAADPYAGASGVEGTSWSTEWEQAQDRLLENTSLPHTTQSVTFDGKRNSGLPGASEENQKTYSANATGHYSQGGAPGTGPQAPNLSIDDPAKGNADINLYIYTANDPINAYDALGLNVKKKAAGVQDALSNKIIENGFYAAARECESNAMILSVFADIASFFGAKKTAEDSNKQAQAQQQFGDGLTDAIPDGQALAMDLSSKTWGTSDIDDPERVEMRNSRTVAVAATAIGVITTLKSKTPHGNSKASRKPQYRYVIKDKATGEVAKTGISGGQLNKDGSSRRANRQVNKLNKNAKAEKYEAVVVEKNIPGRNAALEAERAATEQLRADGNLLPLQKRP